ncbi:hypothetical protein WJX82_001838 [Trebouxia sp. C0006]
MLHDVVQDAERTCQPRLLPGLVSDWPSVQLWRGVAGLQHLQELAGASQASLDPGHPLQALRRDFEVPDVISHADVTRTNLWMSIRGSRSSLHYDPYHNLLCMVQGKKTVKLMSPDATDQLYPFSVLGESPNHSHVNFAHPDDQQHPLYKQALQSQQEFVLQAGDALFIPEGWWHQVDSQDTTIAVNFWWQSAFTKSMQPHMHQYYLPSDPSVAGAANSAVHSGRTEHQTSFHLTAVQLLAAAVADSLDTDNKSGQMSTGLDDPITRILAALPPQDVQSVLSLMSQRVPRTLEALLMHALPPAAAELLTQKLEQADTQGCAGPQQFYADLYGLLLLYMACKSGGDL